MIITILISILFSLLVLLISIQYNSRTSKTLHTYKEELFKEAELRSKLEEEYNIKLNELTNLEKKTAMKAEEIAVLVTRVIDKFKDELYSKIETVSTGGVPLDLPINKEEVSFILDSIDYINSKVESIDSTIADIKNNISLEENDDEMIDNTTLPVEEGQYQDDNDILQETSQDILDDVVNDTQQTTPLQETNLNNINSNSINQQANQVANNINPIQDTQTTAASVQTENLSALNQNQPVVTEENPVNNTMETVMPNTTDLNQVNIPENNTTQTNIVEPNPVNLNQTNMVGNNQVDQSLNDFNLDLPNNNVQNSLKTTTPITTPNVSEQLIDDLVNFNLDTAINQADTQTQTVNSTQNLDLPSSETLNNVNLFDTSSKKPLESSPVTEQQIEDTSIDDFLDSIQPTQEVINPSLNQTQTNQTLNQQTQAQVNNNVMPNLEVAGQNNVATVINDNQVSLPQGVDLSNITFDNNQQPEEPIKTMPIDDDVSKAMSELGNFNLDSTLDDNNINLAPNGNLNASVDQDIKESIEKLKMKLNTKNNEQQ